ncbi:MAG: HNH endonuclease [Myxococcales bacterium]|nr:HNH endonuclease [Myxococcales bacterium]
MLCVGKVEVVKSYDRVLKAVSWSLHMPAVVRLVSFVQRQRMRIAMTRHNIFLRDNYQCQYCLKKLPARDLTRDHVIPRSKGGGMTWENIVAACVGCNRDKGCRTPEEANMHLAKKPEPPRGLLGKYSLNLGTKPEESWKDFLSWGLRRHKAPV